MYDVIYKLGKGGIEDGKAPLAYYKRLAISFCYWMKKMFILYDYESFGLISLLIPKDRAIFRSGKPRLCLPTTTLRESNQRISLDDCLYFYFYWSYLGLPYLVVAIDRSMG